MRIRVWLSTAVLGVSLAWSTKPAPAQQTNPPIHSPTAQETGAVSPTTMPAANDPRVPRIVQSPLVPAIAESLSALVEEVKASRRERRIIEERWWPPSASWAIVYAIVLYVGVAAFQIKASIRQAKLSTQLLAALRRHLNLAARAKIPVEPIIQSMRLHGLGTPEVFVTYEIVNTGGSHARVLEHQSAVAWHDRMAPAKLPAEYARQPANYDLAPSQHRPATLKPARPMSEEEAGKVIHDNLKIYVSGFVRYGNDDTEYRTDFACRYDPTQPGTFMMAGEPGDNFTT
jgi:hypothetical protein